MLQIQYHIRILHKRYLYTNTFHSRMHLTFWPHTQTTAVVMHYRAKQTFAQPSFAVPAREDRLAKYSLTAVTVEIAVVISNEIRDSIAKHQTIQPNPMSAGTTPLRVCCATQNQHPAERMILDCISSFQQATRKVRSSEIFLSQVNQGVFSKAPVWVQRVFGWHLLSHPYEPRAQILTDAMTWW